MASTFTSPRRNKARDIFNKGIAIQPSATGPDWIYAVSMTMEYIIELFKETKQ